MRLVLLGVPGSGKGTQAEKICACAKVAHISTGDLLRDAVTQGTELCLKAKQYMDAGDLVPDELVVNLVNENLGASKVDAFLLDGFPRTENQAKLLDEFLQKKDAPLNSVVFLEVGEELVIKRLTARRSCGDCGKIYHLIFSPPKQEGVCDACGKTNMIHRSDDREEAIVKRLEAFQEQTAPLVAYYKAQEKLVSIPAEGSVDEVFVQVAKTLGLEA